jgi:hypothetical protein
VRAGKFRTPAVTASTYKEHHDEAGRARQARRPSEVSQMISHMATQGLSTTDLRIQAAEILGNLTEDQLLVVLAYARALAVEHDLHASLPDHILDDLLEDRH